MFLYCSSGDDQYLFLSGSHDQAIYLWRLTIETDDECDLKGHVTLIHQCKGHARSVEAMDISPDKSKVSLVCLMIEFEGQLTFGSRSLLPDHSFIIPFLVPIIICAKVHENVFLRGKNFFPVL